MPMVAPGTTTAVYGSSHRLLTARLLLSAKCEEREEKIVMNNRFITLNRNYRQIINFH
jgi:hypothetical protein